MLIRAIRQRRQRVTSERDRLFALEGRRRAGITSSPNGVRGDPHAASPLARAHRAATYRGPEIVGKVLVDRYVMRPAGTAAGGRFYEITGQAHAPDRVVGVRP
jgi:hypothetical protein